MKWTFDIESKKAVIVSNLSKNLWMIALILFSLIAVILLKVPAIGTAQEENLFDNSTLINETLTLPDIVNDTGIEIVNDTANETIINDTGIVNETIINENYTNETLTPPDIVNNTNPEDVLINDTVPVNKSKLIFSIQEDISVPGISFAPPTPANGAITANTSIIANISVTNASDMKEFKWNWNGTNYFFYDNSLDLMMNFDNVSVLGENSTKVVDVSSNSLNGTVFNTIFNATGKYGGAYQFNGINAWINGTKMATNAVNNWAIAAWIKPSSLPQGGSASSLLIYNGNDGGGYGFGIGNGVGLAGSKLTGLFGTVAWLDGGYTFASANTWYHVVMTRVSGTTYFYVNGVQTVNTSVSVPVAVPNAFSIGCQLNLSNGPSRYFNGTIDEVRIYNKSLSANEVTEQYYSNLYKYDSDKWVFITNQSILISRGNYTYQGCANNTLGVNCTGTRIIYAGDWMPPGISFTNPTPANGTFTANTFAIINISIINASDLNEFKWNWNGTNYTFYNNSLVLMLNLDNVSALGESSTKAVDVSPSSNNATFTNAPTWTTAGKYNKALNFAGTTYATTTITGFSASKGTVLMWIKPNKDLRAVTQAFFDTLPSGIGALRIYSNNDNTLRYETGGTLTGLAWTIPSNWTGQWHQIGLNWSGSVTALIVDGAVVASGGNTQAPAITTFEIGRYNSGSNFNGTIDEVRVWNRTLSASEINQSYFSNLNKYDTDKWAFITNQSNLTAGTYTYQGFAKDVNTNANQTDLNYLYIDLTAPTTTLVSPLLNANITTSNIVNFTCNATDNFMLKNITFYWNYTGTWQANGTISVTGIFNQTNFSRANLNNGAILWNCLACDNASQCSFASANYTVNVAVVSTIPTLTFLLQNPADVSTTNALVRGVNITYNITSPSGINTSTVFIYYKTNSTASDIFIYRDGASISGYQQKTGMNVSTNWIFNQQDNEIYPGTYNYDELALENTLHLTYSLGGNDDYFKIRLFNVSNTKQYSFFEVMAYNVTANSGNLRVYYCNATYTNENPATASICTNFYSMPASQPYNHTHTAYSSHYVIPFAINTTNGQIGNVRVTETSYFLLRGATPSSWNVSYISNVSRNDTIQTTVDIGGSWTNLSGTADSHLHQFQFDGTEKLYYYVCANNTLGESNCSNAIFDLLNLSGLPPTPPNVYNPITGRYRDGIEINYTASLSPNGYAISLYNISLVLTNYTFVKTIQTNNSVNLSYLWNSTGTNDGEYKIRVQACDNLSQCNYGYSENFTLDNSYPQWSNPSMNETIVYYNMSIQFNATWTNAQLSGYIFSIKQNGTYWNSSYIPFSGTTNVSENISLIIVQAGTNITWFFWANDSAGNSNQTDIQSFIIQTRNTTVTLSTDNETYHQGKYIGGEYDTYITFNARYLDNLENPIPGADCIVINSQSSSQAAVFTLIYNPASGNYTGNISTFDLYDTVVFNVTCSKTNYVSAGNSTTANVWLYAYLWETTNHTYDGGRWTTHYLKKQPITDGNLYVRNYNVSTSSGMNLITNLVDDIVFCDSDVDCGFVNSFLFTPPFTMRMNLSINDSACSPVLCKFDSPHVWEPVNLDCGSPVSISANIPTLIESNYTGNELRKIDSGFYMGMALYLNCTADVNEQVNVYYNYTNEPANLFIKSAQRLTSDGTLVASYQLDSNYTLGPNMNVSSTRRYVIHFNNSRDNLSQDQYIFLSRILAFYTNSIAPNTTYVYNSSGGLLASDNASAGPNSTAQVSASNQISWTTELIPGHTAINETLNSLFLDSVRDNEYLILNTSSSTAWNVTVISILVSDLQVNNLVIWTNYSAYGVGSDRNFTVLRNINGTLIEITSQCNFSNNGTIFFPMINFSRPSEYTIIAGESTPPTIHLISPQNRTLTSQPSQIFSCNITNVEILSLALNIWNSSGDLINTNTTSLSGTFNQTDWTFTLPYDDSWQWNCLGYDTSGNHDWSSEGNYTITLDRVAPTINVLECTPSQTNINGTVVCNATITDAIGIDSVKANATLPNTTVIWATIGNLTSNYYFTFNYTELQGRYNITWFANDSAGNSNISEGYFIVRSVPSVFIIAPHGEVFDQRNYVPILTNASDPDGIGAVISQVTLPDGTKVNITLDTGQESDNFDADSIGIKWIGENSTVSQGQICVADIDTTASGAAYTSISGSGMPYTDSYCSILSKKAVAGDFDINISFNATNFTGSDMAVNLVLTEEPASIIGENQIFMSLGNWTGTGQEYQMYVIARNFSDFVSRRNTTDTYGKFRITRVNDTFTFYTWNISSWFEENMSQHNFSLNKALYITLQSETSVLNWGTASASWDDLTIISSNYTFGMFSSTNLTGNYNITIIATDTLGTLNGTEKTNFTTELINSRPSVPFVLYPYVNSVINGVKNITWSNVVDKEGDSLQFNITLLNIDYSFNSTIVSNYGSNLSTKYQWNTSLYQDGVYSIKVMVFENASSEGLNRSNSLYGSFTIDNTPPEIQFVAPMPASGSVQKSADILVNITASDSHLSLIRAYVYDSSHVTMSYLESSISPVYFNFSSYSGGLYYFNATATDTLGNTNSTETKNVTIDTIPPNITSTTISPYDPVIGYNITFNATATDNIGISEIFVNITLPNTTVITLTLPMVNYTLQIDGRHNATFWANDTAGNVGTSSADYFIAGVSRVNAQFNVIDNNSAGLPANLTIYFTGTDKAIHEQTFTGSYADVHTTLIYDLYYQTLDGNISVKLNEVNLSLYSNGTLGLDRTTDLTGYLVTYGLNSTYNFTNATVALSYAGTGFTNENYLGLYKCSNWNFINRTCAGTWESVTGTQDQTLDVFTLTVTSFSAYSIKQEQVPSPPGPGGPSGGNGGGAAERFNISIKGDCVGDYVDIKVMKQGNSSFYVSDVQILITDDTNAQALLTNAEGIARFKPSIAGNYTFEFKKGDYLTKKISYIIKSCVVEKEKPAVKYIPETTEKAKKSIKAVVFLLAIILAIFIIIKVLRMRRLEREFHHEFVKIRRWESEVSKRRNQ